MPEKKGVLTKEEVIKREKRRLSATFAKKAGDSASAVKMKKRAKDCASSLIDEIAFMAGSLYELRQIIDENGYIEEYKNGENQWGKKKSSAVEIYNTMIKNYTNCIRQLDDMLPKDALKPEEPDDGFEDFLNGK